MSHRAIRDLVRDATQSLSDNIQFGYGRRSDFNIENDKRYPFVWMLPLTATTILSSSNAPRTKTWNVVLVIIDIDKSDSIEQQYDDILDAMDELGDKILVTIDDWYQQERDIVGTLTIANINQTTIIKDDADIHTGWLFSFQMTVSDSFDYCPE